MRTSPQSGPRLVLLYTLLTVSLLLVMTRLLFIQVVEAKKYQKLALKEHLRAVELPPYRGTIYDRNGKKLAVSIEAATVYATPYLIKNPSKVAKRLAPILEKDKSEILKKLTEKRGFVYLARKISQKKGRVIENLKLEGIGVLKESKRYYPFHSLISQVLGFAGLDNQGLSGLELYYDKFLKGVPGKLITETDPKGRSIPGGVFKLISPRHGKDLVLTLDIDLQYKVEEELKEVLKNFKAKSATAIVMNPKTGEILSMATIPAFDLNKFSKAKKEALRNRAVTDIFEPGSTMKVVTAAAALEERLASPQNVFYLPGTIRVADQEIEEAHPRGGRSFSFTKILTESSNVGAITLGLKLGKERLYQYIKTFGLTKKTKVDFPGEVSGFTLPPDEWSGSTIGNVPFGQGLSATPLQMVQVLATIANGGLQVQPYFLSEVIDKDGKVVKAYSLDPGEKIISTKTSTEMKLILEKAVNEGTGKSAKIPQYRVAGKTGTAQKPKEKGRGYDPGKYVASFMGFAPVEDPQVLTLVLVDEPESAIYGGVVAAPAFKDIMEFALHHLKIAPNP